MLVKEFVENYKAKKFMNIKTASEEKSEWLRNELKIKTYIPFKQKREIAEMIVEQNVEVIDGIKKYDSIDGYIGFIIASIAAHTSLKFSNDPVADYDLLAESGLLPQIIMEFQSSHDEIGVLLKMSIESELEDNNPGALIGRFLDSVLKKLDNASGAFGKALAKLDLKKTFSEENAAKIVGLLNK